MTLASWASGYGWDVVYAKQPVSSYHAAWVQICLRSGDHNGVKISIDGARFLTKTITAIPPLAPFLIGSSNVQGSSRQPNSDYYWVAAGTGTLGNIDAALINSFGNTDKTRSDFPGSAFFIWWAGDSYFNKDSAAFNFTISTTSASKTITQGQSAASTITSTLLSGTSQPVSFFASGFPSGATSSFSPASCPPTCISTLTINTLNSTTTGNYTINVNGIAGGLTRTTNFRLSVNPIIKNSCSWDFYPEGNSDGKVTLGDVIAAVNNFGKTPQVPDLTQEWISIITIRLTCLMF